MKVGDLVQYRNRTDPYRKRGIVVSFDSDDDPVVHWFKSAITYPEPCFRSQVRVL